MKLVAPEGFVSAEILGTPYEADEEGNVLVTKEDHAAILLSPAHGFTYHPDDQDAHLDVPESGAPTQEQLAEHEKSLSEGGEGGQKTEGEGDEEDEVDEERIAEVRAMNKADLIDFIEERGGEIEGKPTKDELIEQAIGLLSSKD